MSSLAFSANGRTAWAGSRFGGVFRSADAGRTWTAANAGMRGEVRDLAAAAGAPARVYAATSEGVFRSDDAGNHWAAVSAGLPAEGGRVAVRMVATEPQSPDAVWVALDPPGQLFRSTDRGATWKDAAGTLPAAVFDLAFHPARPGVVFAATTAGLFRTQDSGRTWARWGLRGQPVWRVVFDRDPGRLYAMVLAAGPHGTFGELRFSADGGATWKAALPGFVGLGQLDLVADPLHAGTAWATASAAAGFTVFQTSDGGLRWNGVEEGGAIGVLAASPRRPVVLGGQDERSFGAADRPAVIRSDDSGGTWGPSGAGLADLVVRTVVPNPQVEGAAYAQGDCCTIWRRDGAGLPWVRLPADDVPPSGFYRLEVDPRTPSTVYLGTVSGVFKSEDSGVTWRDLHAPFLLWLALDPAHPAVLYGATSADPVISKSDDGGASWRALPGSAGLYSRYVTVMPRAVYADGFVNVPPYRSQVRRSTDGGVTWTEILDLGIPNAFVRSVAEDPRNADRLWVGFAEMDEALLVPLGGGVFRTADGGAHWMLSRPGGGRPVFAMTIDPESSQRVWAASDRGTVFQSEDGGATWAPYGEGLPPAAVLDLRVDPFDPDRLYAATEGGGVYVLTRSGV